MTVALLLFVWIRILGSHGARAADISATVLAKATGVVVESQNLIFAERTPLRSTNSTGYILGSAVWADFLAAQINLL